MKKVAIMQPYIFPYLGYFQLINSVDEFILYDNIQYTKKGWFNRNRMLQLDHDILFTIPLQKDSDYLNVNQRYLSNDADREIKKILRFVDANYKKAPHYKEVKDLVEECLNYDDKNLFNFIQNSLVRTLDYLNINTKVTISSTVDIDHERLKSQDKVLGLCLAVGADIYINPIGGRELYDAQSFNDKGVRLLFLKSALPEYRQFGYDFVPGLSIIDVMMFNSVENINLMLDNYELS